MVSSKRDWYEPAGEPCRHGHPYGDCPLLCMSCGHRCELHREVCEAFDCACEAWLADDKDEGEH